MWVAVCVTLLFSYSAFLTILLWGVMHTARKNEKDIRVLADFIGALCTPGKFEIAFVPKKSINESNSPGKIN